MAVCEAVCEENPRDGVAAAALAELLLDRGDAERALEVLRGADMPAGVTPHGEAIHLTPEQLAQIEEAKREAGVL